MTDARPEPVAPKPPLQMRFDQATAIQNTFDQLLLDMEAVKTEDRQPTDRHIAICITKLEDIIGRWEKYVTDYQTMANEAGQPQEKTP